MAIHVAICAGRMRSIARASHSVSMGGHLDAGISVCRHKIVILMVVNGGKMRTKGE